MLKESIDFSYLKEKFIIFSYGRCGTTSICNCLNYSNLVCLCEPLKPDFKGFGPLSKFTETYGGINLRLKECGNFDGIKHLGCQVNYNFNKHFVSKFGKIIYVSRRNILQSAISMVIAVTDRKWHERPSHYDALDINHLWWQIDHIKKIQSDFDEIKKIRSNDVLEIVYEDFFVSDVDQRVDSLKKIFDFLGKEFVAHDRIYEILSCSRKVNPENYYCKIPNIKEIEEKFGSCGSLGSLIEPKLF